MAAELAKTKTWLVEQGFADSPKKMDMNEDLGELPDNEINVYDYFYREAELKETFNKFKEECTLCNESEMCRITKRFWGGYMFAATNLEQLRECIDDCTRCVFLSEELIEAKGGLYARKHAFRKENKAARKKISEMSKKVYGERMRPVKPDDNDYVTV